MKENEFKAFEFDINPHAPLFVIGVVSELIDLPIWTLRKLDELGVVQPKRLGSRTRCYSQQQIIILNHIRYLIREKGVNIKGVKMIIEMEYRQEDVHESND